ncbi:LPS export ABC transporter periplasmic protein LptC [Desulfoplanes formicivorans]|uniref:LPS export ABC transporter periplasmic protein LptC n=1 Tax=Desulfoplanes formicivorans TaxID=1592317 RepID=A0A194AI59_9BACT|nr:LPS export ABC transporter periplasmic protein LptC [Desulfoplanes formicivorans]GAU09013.1 hypothetical protein DPF_1732 [Desulfoplanes formicivorans]
MKKTICLFLVVAVAGIVLTIWHLRKDVSVSPETPSLNMDLSLQGVTLRQGSKGRLLWTLNATSADYRKDQGVVFVTDPEILYFQEEESTPVYVEGDHGRIDQKNDQADIWSHVLVRYQGSVLTTQSLHYNGTSSLLLCNKDVEIRRKDMVLTSQRATLELATKRVQAHGQVKAVLMADSPLPSP